MNDMLSRRRFGLWIAGVALLTLTACAALPMQGCPHCKDCCRGKMECCKQGECPCCKQGHGCCGDGKKQMCHPVKAN